MSLKKQTHRKLVSETKVGELKAFHQFVAKTAIINCTREGASPPYRHEMDEDICI